MGDRREDLRTRTAPGRPSSEVALGLAVRGWSVVAVHTPSADGCSCGRPSCPSPGKHPRIRWERFTDRSATPAELTSWWERWPDANVGVVTGWVSRVVVLDVDPRHGGEESLAALVGSHGPVPDTVTTRTGGGGRHLWFAHPPRLVPCRLLGPGLDLRAEGGLVVVPPSLHPSGHRYRWVAGHAPGEVPLAGLPAWIEERSLDPVGEPPSPVPSHPERTPRERAVFASLWDDVGVRLATVPIDARGESMVRCPFHDDHRPSLHIDHEGCRWFCFGCRRGGGIRALRRLVHPGAVHVDDEPLHGPAGRVGEPTLAPEVTVDVVGESVHQDELLELTGGQRSWSGAHRRVLAQLVPDPDNPVDPRAVAVVIEGRPVGHLPREVARAYGPLIASVIEERGQATGLAEIRGGWERPHGDVGRFGVVVQVPSLGDPGR